MLTFERAEILLKTRETKILGRRNLNWRYLWMEEFALHFANGLIVCRASRMGDAVTSSTFAMFENLFLVKPERHLRAIPFQPDLFDTLTLLGNW